MEMGTSAAPLALADIQVAQHQGAVQKCLIANAVVKQPHSHVSLRVSDTSGLQ